MVWDTNRSNVDTMLPKDIAHGGGLNGVTSWCSSPMALLKVDKRHQMQTGGCETYLDKCSLPWIKTNVPVDLEHEGLM